MITAILLGILASFFIFLIGTIISDDNFELFIFIPIAIVVIFISACIGKDISIKEYELYIRDWKNTKEVIESSMENENISDLEKIELIKTITEYNMQLEGLKTKVTYWWNYYLDDSKVNELEIIKIK